MLKDVQNVCRESYGTGDANSSEGAQVVGSDEGGSFRANAPLKSVIASAVIGTDMEE